VSANGDSRYAAALCGPSVAEAAPVKVPGELEIQAQLFNGAFGCAWRTLCGRCVEVLHFGDWNREAGPDFKGAVVRFDGGEETKGDIEVDPDARDWERHGHATNPAYANVVLQFFLTQGREVFFARTQDNRSVPQVRLPVETDLRPSASPRGGHVGIDEARAMIAEAAAFRLRTKHAAYCSAETLHGADAALFHAIAAGLGYKNNAIPFLLVAARAGLRRASAASGEALLFGLAGFLAPRHFDDADEITKKYLKPLWDEWWTVRDANSLLMLDAGMWKLSGIRPSNHPHRRLGALAVVAARFPRLRRLVSQGGPAGFREFFESLDHPYWSFHFNLSAGPLGKKTALVGSDRVLDLLINAHIPTLEPERGLRELGELRGPTPSGRVRRACDWLAGGFEESLVRNARDQQGLIQLHGDFGHLTAREALERINPGS
jgi:hypothetical protein